MPPDGRVVVRGVVIAEAGRIGHPSLIVIADATGGLPVRLQDGQVAPVRGTVVEAAGTIADPYGQTELRLRSPLVVIGSGDLPAPSAMGVAAAGEATEGRLVRTSGTIAAAPSKATGGDIVLTISSPGGATLRVYADSSAGVSTSALRKGAAVALTGIVGQRASRKGVLDGYRLWLRDQADITLTAAPSPTPSASSSPSPSAGSGAPLLTIAAAKVRDGDTVTLEATVTTSRTLLDASGRRAIAEDASGAIELYLERPDPAIRAGVRVRATGTIGRAWGAPRLRVGSIKVLGRRTPVAHELRVAPGAATEWRLVRIRGTVGDVHKDGDRWTAEVAQGGLRLLVAGLAGSGIPSTALVEGRSATVTGIVKRPYPTATDRRFAIVPRSGGDIALGAAAASPTPAAGRGEGRGAGPAASPLPGMSPAPAGSSGGGTGVDAVDIELRDLGAAPGSTVRVGGLVTAVTDTGFELDDGTATGRVVLEGEAADLAGLVQPGDAVNATGLTDDRDGPVLVVADPADLVLLGDLGASGAAATGSASTMTAALMGAAVGPGTPGLVPIDAALAGVGDPDPAMLAAATIGLTITIGIGLAAWLRYRSVLRTRRRIAVRLAQIGGEAAVPPGGPASV